MSKTKETPIQTGIMNMLTIHKDVAWAFVTSTGVFRGAGGRRYKIGKKGVADILGQLKTGRALAIEVKFPGEEPSEDQYEFLRIVALNGGVSFWCCSAAEADYYLRIYHKYGL